MEEANNKVDTYLAQLKEELAKVFINCWSIDTEESYALWKIYLSGEKNGVAIKTTVSLLRKSIDKNCKKDIILGRVNYSNYIKEEDINAMNILSTKKPFYRYENELRLFYDNKSSEKELGLDSTNHSVRVKIDPDLLIKQIYLSPFADEWVNKMIIKFLDTYFEGLKDKVIKSRVNDN